MAADRTIFVIGFGAVGQAWYKFISHVNAKGLLKGVRAIRYFAPEIKAHSVDGSASGARARARHRPARPRPRQPARPPPPRAQSLSSTTARLSRARRSARCSTRWRRRRATS
jgi:hypothetical protein